MGEKGDFVSTLIRELNQDQYGGFGPFNGMEPYGLEVPRGGFTFVYDDDPDDEEEYFVIAVDESQMEWISLSDRPDALLRLLELAGPGNELNWVPEDKMLAYLHDFGPLTRSFLRAGADEESELYWNQSDPRNHEDSMFRFSWPAHEVKLAVHALRNNDLVEIFRRVDLSPAPSLYRALLLYVLGLALAGDHAPRSCEGCGKWFFETENASTAVHRTGWKRKDAKYHSVKCMKAASERRRRARKRAQKSV